MFIYSCGFGNRLNIQTLEKFLHYLYLHFKGSYVILKKEGRVLASLTKNTDEEAIVALPDVKAATLEKVIEYCKFHSSPNTSEREKKTWDTAFVQVKQNTLCELASVREFYIIFNKYLGIAFTN